MEKNRRATRNERTKQNRHQVIRIDVLPDDVLLDIFDSYMIRFSSSRGVKMEAWQPLVHVCRRWRSLVLESPRRLNLRLFCTPKTPARDRMDVWPALPLIIQGSLVSTPGIDNFIAALGQSNRVREVFLSDLAGWQLENVLATMEVPFPELTVLRLRLLSHGETPPVIPDSFLDGSAPRLGFFSLNGIPFPGFPKLLSSATHLVYLWLIEIPHSGYVSPEAMVALLCALSSLESLYLKFQSPQSRPNLESRSLPPPRRSILPVLDEFHFKGVTEYLEDLVTFIDTPQLDHMHITFFNQIDIGCPPLAQFINRTPTFMARNRAYVQYFYWSTSVTLIARERASTFTIEISSREPDFQLSPIAQVCNSSLPPLSMVEDLYVEYQHRQPIWKNDDAIDAESALWLELLLPFTAVKNLCLSKQFAPCIVAALQEPVGARITEVLPKLQNIFVEELRQSEPLQEKIGQFVSARQLSDPSIAISVWDCVSDGEWVRAVARVR